MLVPGVLIETAKLLLSLCSPFRLAFTRLLRIDDSMLSSPSVRFWKSFSVGVGSSNSMVPSVSSTPSVSSFSSRGFGGGSTACCRELDEAAVEVRRAVSLTGIDT